MAGGSEVRAGGAFVEIYAKDTQFRKDLDNAATRFKSLGKSISHVGAGIAGAGAAIGIGLWEMAKHAAEGGAALAEMSERTGMSVESLSAFKGIVLQAGLEMADFETAIKKMQKAAYGDDAAKLLAKIGVAADDFQKMNPHEQLLTVADALSKVDNDGKRAALSMDIFGKAGSKMLNVIGGGRAEVEEMMHQMKELGLVSSTEGAEGARKMMRSMILLDLVNKKIVGTIGSALIPVITSLNRMDISSHGNLLKTIQANKQYVIAIALLATGMVALGVTVAGTGAIFWTFSKIISASAVSVSAAYSLFKSFAVLMAVLGSSTGALIGAWVLLGIAVAGLGAQIIMSTEKGRKWVMSLGGSFKALVGDVRTAWNGIVGALSKGDLAAAIKIALLEIQLEWRKASGQIQIIWQEMVVNLKITTAFLSASLASQMLDVVAVFEDAANKAGGFWKDMIDGLRLNIIDTKEAIGAITHAEAETQRKALFGKVQDRRDAQNAAQKKIFDDRDQQEKDLGKIFDAKVDAIRAATKDATGPIEKELADLRAALLAAAKPAADAPGGKGKGGGGGDFESHAASFGQIGAGNINQTLGQSGDRAQNPAVKAHKEVKEEVKKVHGGVLRCFGVLKEQLDHMKAMGQQPDPGLWGP